MPRFLLTLLILAGAVPALIYGGMTLGFRADMVDLGTLFGAMRGWLIKALLGAAAIEMALAIYALLKGRSGLSGLALAFGIVSLAMALGPIQMFKTAQSEGVPPIHDITTDVEDPPQFIATAAMRKVCEDPKTEKGCMNPPEYDREQTAQQLEAYPDIKPILVNADADDAFDASLKAARAIGLDIVEKDRSRGRVEGTATTRWFGFKDDVVIRVRPREGGAVIDIRSKSRIGRSDIRANTDRIRELRRLILAELGEEEA